MARRRAEYLGRAGGCSAAGWRGSAPHPAQAASTCPWAGEPDAALQLSQKHGLRWSQLYSCEPGSKKRGCQHGQARSSVGLCGALCVTQCGGAGGITWPLPRGKDNLLCLTSLHTNTLMRPVLWQVMVIVLIKRLSLFSVSFRPCSQFHASWSVLSLDNSGLQQPNPLINGSSRAKASVTELKQADRQISPVGRSGQRAVAELQTPVCDVAETCPPQWRGGPACLVSSPALGVLVLLAGVPAVPRP